MYADIYIMHWSLPTNVKTQRNVVSDFPGFFAKVPPLFPDGFKTP